MTSIAARIGAVRDRIRDAEERYGRRPGAVDLVAVSKMRPAADVLAALRTGQHRFGESQVQEAMPKIRALAGRGLEWHFIGPVQANKTRSIAAAFDWVHSVERIRVAQRLSDQRPDDLPALNLCLQVNMSGEGTKAGVHPDQVLGLARAVTALPRLRLRGLMTIPAPSQDRQRQREPFRALHALLDTLNAAGFVLDTLSMGMSADMEAAIAEGATIVRVGTDIFGRRPAKR